MKVQQQLIKAIHLPFDKSDRGKSFFCFSEKMSLKNENMSKT